MKQYLIIALALIVQNAIAQNSTSTQASLPSCTAADHPTSYYGCLGIQCNCKASIESCQALYGGSSDFDQCIAASELVFNNAISSVSYTDCECDTFACSAAIASSIDCSLPTCTANDHPTSYENCQDFQNECLEMLETDCRYSNSTQFSTNYDECQIEVHEYFFPYEMQDCECNMPCELSGSSLLAWSVFSVLMIFVA